MSANEKKPSRGLRSEEPVMKCSMSSILSDRIQRSVGRVDAPIVIERPLSTKEDIGGYGFRNDVARLLLSRKKAPVPPYRCFQPGPYVYEIRVLAIDNNVALYTGDDRRDDQ